MLCTMFTKWYYYQDGEHDLDGPSGAFSEAFKRAIICLGTIAIGSLLITIAIIIRIVLFIFTAEQHVINPESNIVYRWFLGFLNCMAWIIEKICQQFTK